MRKRRGKRFQKSEVLASATLIVMLVSLVCGLFAGSIAASHMQTDSADAVRSYVQQSMEGNRMTDRSASAIIGKVTATAQYPGLAFLLGFTVFGVFLIPVVVLVRGFSLAFSVSSVIRVFGAKGAVAAVSMYGFQTLFALPCLLLLALQGIRLSGQIFRAAFCGRKQYVFSGIPEGYFKLSCICGGALILSSAAEICLVPKLLSIVLPPILT